MEGTDKVRNQVRSLGLDLESSRDLKIPTLPVSGTPAGWLPRSKLITNRMAAQLDGDSSCDEAASSLGDSSYDFLDDRSVITDDEERDPLAESTSSESLEAERPSTVSSPWARNAKNSQPDDSPVTMKTPTSCESSYGSLRSPQDNVEEESLAEDPEEPIEFEEPSVVNLNTSRLTEVCYTLRAIRKLSQVKGNLQNAIKGMPEGNHYITVRQTMVSQSLQLTERPYKVLVVGDDPATELIIKKIATALAAYSRPPNTGSDDVSPAKFSIVPVSAFGDSGHPDVVLIDSSGLELSVEYCTAATYTSTQENKDILGLRMADGSLAQSWWWESKANYAYSNEWKLPDLAVFFSSGEEDPQSKRTAGVAHSFMHRHGVPSIVIQKTATWVKSSTLDYLTPHLCLESQPSNGYNAISRKRFPIDLSTFLNIDAGQLNRNLACLAHSRRSREPPADNSRKCNESQGSAWYSDSSNAFCQTVSWISKEHLAKFFRSLRSFSLPVALMLFGAFLSYLMIPANFKVTPVNQSISTSNTSSIVREATLPPLSSTFAPIVTDMALTSSRKPSTKSLSSNTEIASFLLDAYALGPDRSDDFLVQLLGDRHIVVNTPRWMHQSKRAPSLLFEVSRQNKSIEYTSSKIGEGVYALQIPYEEAYGMLNLGLTIQSKQVKQKNFEVDFGSSWLQKGAWKRASRTVSDAILKDLTIVQSGLTNAYNHSLTELSTFVYQTRYTLAAQKKIKHAMLASHLKWRSQTRALLLAQMKELSRSVSQVRAAQKQVTEQVRYFKKSLTQDVHDRVRALSLQADLFTKQINQARAHRHLAAREYLKNTQKKALRAWWKIVGVPKTSRLHNTAKREAPRRENGDERLCVGKI